MGPYSMLESPVIPLNQILFSFFLLNKNFLSMNMSSLQVLFRLKSNLTKDTNTTKYIIAIARIPY